MTFLDYLWNEKHGRSLQIAVLPDYPVDNPVFFLLDGKKKVELFALQGTL